MIKISANISKKVPLPGVEYSSQQFGAAMEIEVSDADQPEAIHGRIRDLYALLSQSVDEQIASAKQLPEDAPTHPLPRQPVQQSQPVQNAQPPAPQRAAYTNGNGRNRVAAATSTNGNGNGRRVTCTEAQAKCIYAICKSQGLDMISVLADFNVSDARELHVRDASRLIDQLKAQNGNGAVAH